ncbi:tyrosine-type recombinase/integrase (plasmid) [Methanocaldococcus indicus]|uniref:tyrosine-type recombinase/integrase n=1 Tax=Methanocaldococcus indicus TaxID=213231 RepID=UPI0039C961B8
MWDRALNFDATLKFILSEIDKTLDKKILYKYDKIRLLYLSIALIQLKNGCRVGEAVDSMLQYLENGTYDVNVRIGKRKDNAERKVIIPVELDEIVNHISDLELPDKKTIVKRVKSYFITKYNINTHSFRYAYITKLSTEGVPAQVIAKITGHKKLDCILHYTNQKAADNILKKFSGRY